MDTNSDIFQGLSVIINGRNYYITTCLHITVHILKSAYNLVASIRDIYSLFLQVETIGDAYMVVGGAPVKTKLHAVRIVEMSIAMKENIVELIEPSTGENMAIRVGKY